MTKRICKNCQYYRAERWCSNTKSPHFHFLKTYCIQLGEKSTCSAFTQRGKKAPLWMRATNKVLGWLKAVSK